MNSNHTPRLQSKFADRGKHCTSLPSTCPHARARAFEAHAHTLEALFLNFGVHFLVACARSGPKSGHARAPAEAQIMQQIENRLG